jgi:hypothetical protein
MGGLRRTAGSLAGLVLGGLLVAPLTSAGDWAALVADGARWWSRAPDPAQPVSCATCHHDPDATRGWAASFPKVRPLPPPHTRVMTLLQATSEAVARHYRLRDPRPVAVAISAFLTARGVGSPITPGVSPGQPVFPTRMRELARSVERGQALYARRCEACHDPMAEAPGAGGFLRTPPLPAELFLEVHSPAGQPIRWDSPAMADLLAYLLAHRVGEPVTGAGACGAQESSR